MRRAGRAPCARPLRRVGASGCVGCVFMFRGAFRPAGRAKIAFGSCFLLQGAACLVFISHLALVRRAAPRSPRRAPPPHAPLGAPAGRGGASPSPLGGGALYPVGVLAGCAPLLLPLRRGVCPPPSVCPRRVGRAVRFRARRFAPRASPCVFHFLAAFAVAGRRRRRGGVTPRPRRARSPSRWRASV